MTGENSLRAYFDVENKGSIDLTKLNVWLIVYIQDRANPVLFEKTFATTIEPGSTKNFFWEVTLLEYGIPVDGAIVPQKVEFTDNTVWNLSENYMANEYSNGNVNHSAKNVLANGHTVSTVDPSYFGKMLQAAHNSGEIKLDGVLDKDTWKREQHRLPSFYNQSQARVSSQQKTLKSMFCMTKRIFISGQCSTIVIRMEFSIFRNNVMMDVPDTFLKRIPQVCWVTD